MPFSRTNLIILGVVVAGAAAVAIWMYYRDRKNKYVEGYPTDACGYFAETIGNSSNAKALGDMCTTYQQVCGNASAAAEMLSLSSMDPMDPDGSLLNALQSDVLGVQRDVTTCMAPLACGTMGSGNNIVDVGCPPFLKCDGKKCI